MQSDHRSRFIWCVLYCTWKVFSWCPSTGPVQSTHILSSTCMHTCSVHFMKCASHVTCVELVARHLTLHCISPYHRHQQKWWKLHTTYVQGCTPKVHKPVYQEMVLRCVSCNRVCNIVKQVSPNLGCLDPLTTGKGSSTFCKLIRSNVIFGVAIIIALTIYRKSLWWKVDPRQMLYIHAQRVNISSYIKDLLYGCIEVSRQVSLIIIALFLTFTTCAIMKKGLDFSGMTFRHWVRYTVSTFHHVNGDQYLCFFYRKYKPVNEVATLFLHLGINSGLSV